MKVIKRNGVETEFDILKIISAVEKANREVPSADKLTDNQILVIAELTEKDIMQMQHAPTVEQIQDLVIANIMRQQAYKVAQLYTEYRYKRELMRKKNTTDDAILSLVECQNEELKQENSNKNSTIASTQRDYIAGEVSKDLTMRTLIPSDVAKEHKDGGGHFHDADYFLQRIHNCDLINLEDMLQNGTVITETMISKPNSLATAANVATQIIAQVASNQYGGQTFTLSHLAPFVDISRQKIRKKVIAEQELIYSNIKESEWVKPKKTLTKQLAKEKEQFYKDKKQLLRFVDAADIEEIVENRLKDEIKAAIQTIQYQLVTLMTTNGQTPFVSMFMYLDEVPEGQTRDDLAMLIEEVLNQRIKGLPNEKGVWITPAFPKLLYTLDEDNVSPDSKYYYLTELAAKCIAKRMVPDCISAKVMKELKGDVYPCMGCRSFLTPDRFTKKGVGNIAKAKNYKPNERKYYGRFNQGVYTMNLVDIACESDGDEDRFWKIFDVKLDIAHKALRCKHERLKGTPSDIAPILWQHGALARLEKGETIDKLLYNGYSTLSLGYAGLYECCKYMTGKSHTDEEAKPFALAVMQKLNDACNQWKEEENIDYSVYGTPLESTTYKFAKALQDKYGKIKDVSDHNYITNSYHVNVREEIDAFTKLKFEAEFQKLSPGGAISYVEVPNMQDNIPAVIKVLQFIYENIMYAELNTKSDYCHECGYDGEIEIKEDEHGKLIWRCPNCGNTDQNKMNVARRTCGYIGTQFWNQGRTQEIKERVLHL